MMKRPNPFGAIRGLLYPTIPAHNANRQVRRAVKFGRNRLPTEWAAFLALPPSLRQPLVTV